MTTIELEPGILPQPACYATEQERFDAYVNAIIASIVSSPEWTFGETVPGPDDQDLYWLRFGSDGRPIGAYKYVVSDATWVPWLWFPVTPTTVTGAANAYSIANTPPFTTVGEAYSLYRTYKFIANFSTTGASTLEVDGLGAKAIKVKVSSDTDTDTIKNGQVVEVVYDGTNFQMVSAVSAFHIVAGDITPGTVDGQIFTTVLISTGPDVFQSQWKTRVYKTADSDAVAIPAGGTPATFAHGLGVRPKFASVSILLTDAGGDLGFSMGTEIELANSTQIDPGLSDDNAPTVWRDTVEIGFQSMVGSTPFRISNKSTGAVTSIDPTKWKLLAFAFI